MLHVHYVYFHFNSVEAKICVNSFIYFLIISTGVLGTGEAMHAFHLFFPSFFPPKSKFSEWGRGARARTRGIFQGSQKMGLFFKKKSDVC